MENLRSISRIRKRDISRAWMPQTNRRRARRDAVSTRVYPRRKMNGRHGPFSTIAVLIGCLYTIGYAVYTPWSRNLRRHRFTLRNALFARQRSTGTCIFRETGPILNWLETNRKTNAFDQHCVNFR